MPRQSKNIHSNTTIYESASDINYLYRSMNSNLSRLTDRFWGNKLSLNVAKTNYMLFSNHISFDESLKMADQNIIQTNCSKFLGIHIDDKLKCFLATGKRKFIVNIVCWFLYPINILYISVPFQSFLLQLGGYRLCDEHTCTFNTGQCIYFRNTLLLDHSVDMSQSKRVVDNHVIFEKKFSSRFGGKNSQFSAVSLSE